MTSSAFSYRSTRLNCELAGRGTNGERFSRVVYVYFSCAAQGNHALETIAELLHLTW